MSFDTIGRNQTKTCSFLIMTEEIISSFRRNDVNEAAFTTGPPGMGVEEIQSEINKNLQFARELIFFF